MAIEHIIIIIIIIIGGGTGVWTQGLHLPSSYWAL
jgi:hypothetical protein